MLITWQYKILNGKQHQVKPVKETVDVKRCVFKVSKYISTKLFGNKRQCALSWQLQRKRFNGGWSVNYGASTIIIPLVSPWSDFLIRGHNYRIRWDKFMKLHTNVCRIKSICRNKNDNPSFIGSWVICPW